MGYPGRPVIVLASLRRALRRPRPALAAATLLALVVRAPRLASLPLHWDEGWSIALAVLPLTEMLDMTARDVHPPLYYGLLSGWLPALGASPWAARVPSALAGAVAVPLAFAATRAWLPPRGRRPAGLAAAAYVALAPPLVYYAGIARMYALSTPLLLLAVYGVGRFVGGAAQASVGARGRAQRGTAPANRRSDELAPARAPRAPAAAAAVLGSVAALLTFYYAGFALAGLGAAALIAWPARWRRILAWSLACAGLALPWLVYAAPRLAERIGARTGGALEATAIPAGMRDALGAAFFVDARAPLGGLLILVAALVMLAMAWTQRAAAVVVLPMACALFGAAVGAQAHMLAPRYAIVATPFIGLGAAWLARAAHGRRSTATLGVLAFGLAVLPTLSGRMHQRTAEVTDPYDPAALPAALRAVSSANDLVVFNVLSLAGAYHALREAGDPPWTYAQLWDPVHEPPERALARLLDRLGAASPAAASIGAQPEPVDAPPAAVWMALHRGTSADDTAAYIRWVDWHLWPLGSSWAGDVLLRAYVDAYADARAAPRRAGDREAGAVARYAGSIDLVWAAYSGAGAPGRGLAVELAWTAERPVAEDLRVFVHAYAQDGALVAQHDGRPSAEARPTTTWRPGEHILDRHGLLLPITTMSGSTVTLVVGLYDAETGARRLRLGGEDAVPLGDVRVGSP